MHPKGKLPRTVMLRPLICLSRKTVLESGVRSKSLYIDLLKRRAYDLPQWGGGEGASSPVENQSVGHDELDRHIISHYRIVEKLGGGGMGVVYKAQDLTLHRFWLTRHAIRALTAWTAFLDAVWALEDRHSDPRHVALLKKIGNPAANLH